MKPKLNLLTDRVFLFSLALLVLNDWILKYQAGGFITGKLSDVAGLFIFPFFWSVFFERQRFAVYILTALLFIFWKLPVSTDAIHAINRYLGTSFTRVVDYTDLFTLLILPVSYAWFKQKAKMARQQSDNQVFVPVFIGMISVIAFVATSMVPSNWSMRYKDIDEKMICNVSKEKIFSDFIKHKGDINHTLNDSIFRITHMTTAQAGIQARTWVRIYPVDTDKTVFVLDSVELNRFNSGFFRFLNLRSDDTNYLQKISRKELIADFKANVIRQIESGKMLHTVYAENPKRDTLRSLRD